MKNIIIFLAFFVLAVWAASPKQSINNSQGLALFWETVTEGTKQPGIPTLNGRFELTGLEVPQSLAVKSGQLRVGLEIAY